MENTFIHPLITLIYLFISLKPRKITSYFTSICIEILVILIPQDIVLALLKNIIIAMANRIFKLLDSQENVNT